MPKYTDIKGDLLEAIYTVVQPSIGQDQKDEIVAHMNALGYEMG